MKTLLLIALSSLLTWETQAQSALNEATNTASQSVSARIILGYQTGGQDGNSRVWQKIVKTTDTQGDVTYQTNNAYTELATGLNHLVNNQWVPSSEEIDIAADGNSAFATNGQHQAYFPGDIYSGQIELVTPDGKQLYSRPMGLSYDDGTHTVLIAELTNATGQVVGNNQVIYASAFTGLKADLRYTYTKAGFEQDIILREQPPTPASFGLNPDTTKLQILTEFFNPPQPVVNATTVPTDAGNLENDNLSFGTMAMGRGKAFMMGNTTPSAEVEKQWVEVSGRQFLMEEVPTAAIADQLEVLPPPQTTSIQPNPPLNVVSTKRLLPAQRLATMPGKHPMQLAQIVPSSGGLVLDYQMLSGSLTNYTFQGDTTYFISGTVTVWGTNTFEGGTVIKYTNSSSAMLSFNPDEGPLGPLICETGPYRPAIFTSMNDNSVGDKIANSTGNPTNTLATYLYNPDYGDYPQLPLHDLRFAYAGTAIYQGGTTTFIPIKNCQFVQCTLAIMDLGAAIFSVPVQPLYNVLMSKCGTGVQSGSGYQAAVDGENMTVDQVTFFLAGDGYGTLSGDFTNCIFTANSHLLYNYPYGGGTFTLYDCMTNASSSGVYQTVGAGKYYLASSSTNRNYGTTNIDSTLLSDLKQKTTYPPLFLTNQVAVNTNFSTQASRDTDTPDLGYHYDPIDYIADKYTVTNATLTLTNGVVIASYNEAGIQLQRGGKLVCTGSPLYPNWFVRYTSVQEGTNLLGGTNNGSGIDVMPVYTSVMPSAQYQFTKFACPAGGGDHLYDYNTSSLSNLTVQECEFYGGTNVLGGTNSAVMTLNNNLFARSVISAAGSGTLSFTNNLVWGAASAQLNPTGTNMWYAFDNDFDSSTITNSTLTNGYNAYLNCSGRLSPTNVYDIVSTNTLAYQTGPLGTFYQPSVPLVDVGSTNANLLGLYHYTTQTNQMPETNSTVDIGYHYVATDTNGVPLDSNGDGTPDYLEDANGNGLVDNGETNWGLAILTQPVSQTVNQGTNTTFSVTAQGIAPLSYKWYFNGTNLLTGETNSSITISNVQVADEGSYQVVVTNSTGSLTSSVAMLVLTCEASPSGLVGWWRGESNALDEIDNNNGIVTNGISYAAGKIGTAFTFDGTNGFIAIPDNPVLDPTNVTVEAWVKFSSLDSSHSAPDGVQYIIFKQNSRGSGFEGYCLAKIRDGDSDIFDFEVTSSSGDNVGVVDASLSIQTNVWYHVAGVRGPDYIQLYVNGQLADQASVDFPQDYGSNPLYFGSSGVSYFDGRLAGSLDEASVYDQALSSNEIAAIYAAGTNGFGKCLTPPIIVTQPSDQQALLGSGAIFSVTATGSQPLSYQWYFDGTTLITNATNSTLILSDVQTNDVGDYSVDVFNAAGSAGSSPALLTVTSSIQFSNFCDVSSLQINGDAQATNTSDGCVLELTPAATDQAGSAFYTTPVSLASNASFSTFFSFRLSKSGGSANGSADDHVGADGIVFVLQTLTNNVGSLGGGIGFWGITNSVGIVFDTWYNTGDPTTDPQLTNSQTIIITTNSNGSTGDGNHVGVVYNGYLTNAATFAYGIETDGHNAVAQHVVDDMNNSNIWYAWIDYNGATSNLEIRLSETNSRPATPTLTNTVNLLDFLGQTNAYLGFTAGTGGSYNQQDILSWQFTSSYNPIGTTNSLSVAITSPTNDQVFIDSPTNVILSANASESDGTITNVSFYQGTNLLGNVTSPNTNGLYDFVWQDVTAGTYSNIMAKATDAHGAQATSTSITITLYAAPSVSIVTPTNLQSYLEVTDVTLSATSSVSGGSISQVQFYYTNSLLGTVTTTGMDGLYSFIWTNRAAGTYPVTAVATDNHGASSVSAITVFRVNSTNTPPTVAITFPTNNEIFADGSDITITATATNGSGTITNVEFFVNGQSIGSDPDAPYAIDQCCWKPGAYSLLAVATDNLGGSGISTNVQITISPPQPEGVGFWDPTFRLPNYSGTNLDECGNNTYWAGQVLAMSLQNSNLFCGTTFGISEGGFDGVFQWDGTQWLRWTGANTAAPCHDLAVDFVYSVASDNNDLYVGGVDFLEGDDYVVKAWNGATWTQLGESLVGGPWTYFDWRVVPQLKVVGSDLYLFGSFTAIYTNGVADTNLQYIVRWDRNLSKWESVGDPLNGPVLAVASLKGELVIGGAFTNASGNTNANHVAMLVGSTWTNLGTGVSGTNTFDSEYPDHTNVDCAVFSLGVCNTNLFVGGDFTTAGGNSNANGIAMWDGVRWSSIGCGLLMGIEDTNWPGAIWDSTHPIVYAIATHGESLYVAGGFCGASNGPNDTVTAYSIAKATWSDDMQKWTWTALDLGVQEVWEPLYNNDPGIVGSLVIVPGPGGAYDVVAGGDFQYAGNNLNVSFDDLDRTTFWNFARWRVGYPQPPNVPSVNITSPTTPITLTNPASIILTGHAVSGYTNIQSADFYTNGVIVGYELNYSPDNASVFDFTNEWDDPTPGVYLITAQAYDDDNLVGTSAPLVVNVKNSTNSITAVNDEYTIPENSPSVRLYVTNNDVPASGLRIDQVTRFPQHNLSQIEVGGNGAYLIYTPLPNIYGTDIFYYSVTNASGSTDSASVTVNILAPPKVQINTPVNNQQIAAPVSPLVITGTASAWDSTVTVTNVTLNIISATNIQSVSQVPTDGTFSFNWTNNDTGFYELIAIATDSDGFTNISSPVTIVLTNSSEPAHTITAIISNLNPASGSQSGLSVDVAPVITNGLFDLQGTAADSVSTNPVAYQVLLYQPISTAGSWDGNPADDYLNLTPFANVTPGSLNQQGWHSGSVVSGDLGTLNLTGVPNGVYELMLLVRGGTDETNTLVEVQLDSQLKIGQFSFSQQDLILPVNGIPITVTRTYSSMNPLSADFGYGWIYSLNSMDVQLDDQRQDVTIGSDNAPFADDDTSDNGLPAVVSVRTGGDRNVTLTLPDGRRVTFAFNPTFGGTQATAAWKTPPGVNATLEAQGSLEIDYDFYGGAYWHDGGENSTYDNYDVPGWILTTKPDNTQYYITRGSANNVVYDPNGDGNFVSATVYGPPKLTKIVQHSGETTYITDNSIYHLTTDDTTNRVIYFDRDAQNRITAIYDPNGGANGLPVVQYVYNQNTGNLIQVLKLVDRDAGTYTTNKYDYNNASFPHYITSIENGDGTTVAENFYDDSGRLTAVQDADGNTTYFNHNTTNDTETVVDRLGNTNTYVYDLNGNVIAQTNALGQVTTNAYDGNNNKTKEVVFLGGSPYATNSYNYDSYNELLGSTDPLGHTNGFTYDGNGELLTSTDAQGHSTTNTYDSYGNLTGTSDALGDTTNYYDTANLLIGSRDAVGTLTTNYYDGDENLIGTATYVGSTILSSNTFTYDDNGNRLTSTVWRHSGGSWVGATTTNIYDAQNRVIATINPDGGTNTTVYNDIGQQAETIDPLNNTNSFTYDDQGHLIQTTYPDGTTSSSAYDANGNRIASTDQSTNTTHYFYDALNRLTDTVYADATTNTTVYDDVGRVAQTIDARGTTNAFGYDVAGRRIAVTNAFGISGLQTLSAYTYDNDGNQITLTDANGHTTTNVFDALNRQVEVEYYDNTRSFTSYDADGRKVADTNQDSIVTLFGYDGAGRLTSVTNALNKVTSYQYDEAGNEIAQIDALLRTNSFVYDDMGRRVAHLMPTNALVERFSYDLAGNMILDTNFNGVIITNQYDAMNRLTSRTSTNSYLVSYTYTPTGQRATMTDPSGTTTYSYDDRDRVLTNATPEGTLIYGYDADGNVTSITSSTSGGTSVTYQYDALNRLTDVTDARLSGLPDTVYHYDPAGNLQSYSYPNGVTNLYQYDSLNRLTSLVWKLNATSLASFTYTLGNTGNRTALSETLTNVSRGYAWQYDALYRLTNETLNTTAPTGTLGYGYDAVGNRTSRSGSLGTLGAQTLAYNTNDWLNTDGYDNNGNTTTNSSSQVYQYDVENRLTNFNGGQVVLVYDGDGNRVKKITSSTTTLYLMDTRNPSGYAQVLEEFTVSGTTNLSKAYTYGLDLINQRVPGSSTNFFVYDGHGSTRELTDRSGNVVNAFVYDAFGTLIGSNAPPQTAYLYCGQDYDSDLGFYYNRARYLNTGTGRFWTSDSTDGNNEDPLSLHKYLYGGDDPVNMVDPLGLAGETDSTLLGKAVEKVIMANFRDRFGINALTGKSILASLGLLGKARLIEQALPDLVNIQQKSVFEIKPGNARKFAEGELQLAGYVVTFNAIDKSGGWHIGWPAEYTPPTLITVDVPPFLVTVTPPVFGVIMYNSFQDVVKNEVKTVATEEEADIEDTEGIATLDSELGAP